MTFDSAGKTFAIKWDVRISYRLRPLFVLACFLVLSAFPLPKIWAQQQNSFTGRVVRVESSDLVVVRLQTLDFNVHLHGITALPRPPASTRALDYVDKRILGATVHVKVYGTAAKQTIYGDIETLDGKNVNQELVRNGLATWANKYAPGRIDLSSLQTDAQRARAGIWGDPTAANVPMPTPAPRRAPTPTPTAKPHPTPTPTPFPTPTPIPTPTATPIPAPTASTATPLPAPTDDAPLLTPTPTPTPQATPTPFKVAIVPPHHPTLPTTPLATVPPPTATPPAPPVSSAPSVLAFLGATAILALVFALRFSFAPSRFPFQILMAALVALGLALMTPVFVALGQKLSPTRGVDAAAVCPPLIAALFYLGVRLCRREQVLHAARELTVSTASDASAPTKELVRVHGITGILYDQQPIVSTIGEISAVYLRELTQVYEAVPEPGGARRGSSHLDARGAGANRDKKRYAWRTILDETQARNFLLADEAGTNSIIVESGRAEFHPLQKSLYYNEVPVDEWFARPYSGDTRTQLTYIPINVPATIWGRVARVPAPDGLDGSARENRLGFDADRETMIVTEGDGAVMWSSKPLVGLLLILLALVLGALLIYLVASPGA